MSPTDQHKDTIVTRGIEATLGLTKNTFSAGSHAGGLYFMFSKFTAGTPEFTIMCMGGFIGAILWLAAAYRSRILMSFWNNRLGAAEEAEETIVPVFSSLEFKKIERARITGAKIFFALIGLILLVWTVSFIYSFCRTRWYLWLY